MNIFPYFLTRKRSNISESKYRIRLIFNLETKINMQSLENPFSTPQQIRRIEETLDVEVEIGDDGSFDEFVDELPIHDQDLDHQDVEWELVENLRPINWEYPYFPAKSYVPEDCRLPHQYFELFFDSDVYEIIIEQTNLYADQFISSQNEYLLSFPKARITKWKEWKNEDVMAYIAVRILMGIHKLPSIEDHFSENKFLQSGVSTIISGRKYHLYNKFFHLADNSKQIKPIDKIQPFLDLILTKIQKYYDPGQHITLDEGIIPFQGRCQYKQYNKMKPEKWGMKMYLLCDSKTGYVWKAKIYQGKEESINNYTTQLTLSFTTSLKNKGYKLFTDNFYTSPELAWELLKKRISITGIVKANRKGLPAKHENLKLRPNETQVYVKNDTLCIYHLDHQKPLILLSNAYSAFQEVAHNDKPYALQKYNEYIHGVDKANQERSYYRYPHREFKWWKAVFTDILEIIIVNAYILYKNREEKPLTHKEFRIYIVKHLLSNWKMKKTIFQTKPSQKMHYFDKIPNKKQRVCCHCRKRDSTWMCKRCSKNSGNIMALCLMPCWEQYHKR